VGVRESSRISGARARSKCILGYNNEVLEGLMDFLALLVDELWKIW